MTRAPITAHVALLRGVNVGGKNKLPMKELAAIFTRAGFTEVQTYIQSGNVIFKGTAARAAEARGEISGAIEKKFGFRVPLVLRSAEQLGRVVSSNPFLEAGDLSRLHVVFLADLPSAAAAATLDAKRSPPDRFTVRGAEIFLSLPNGAAKTKLTNAYFDSKLSTVSTVRNWRTVLKLGELSAG